MTKNFPHTHKSVSATYIYQTLQFYLFLLILHILKIFIVDLNKLILWILHKMK